MQAFVTFQQQQASFQERKLEELTATRLKKAPTNSKFPSLSEKNCNPTQFRDWYNKIISILATDEWKDLYNTSTQDVIPDGHTKPSLNNHFYSALLLALKDSVEQFIQGMPHLCGDGVGVLLALRAAYKGRLTNIEIMQLQGQLLGGLHFRGRNETVEQFASRTLQISNDLQEHGIYIPPTSLKNSFISGLGPDFHDIMKDLNRNRLDPKWQPILIRDLIEPARSYLLLQQKLRANHATYKQSTSNNTSNQPTNPNTQNQPKPNNPENKNEAAIKNGTFKYEDFQKEVDNNKCLYHNSTHPDTKNPSFECTKLKQLISDHPQTTIPKPSKPTTTSTPKPNINPPPQAKTATNIKPPETDQISHNTDDEKINDALDNLTEFGDNLNNNNDTLTPYSPCSYLSITAHSVSIQKHHNISHKTVVDSGAYPMIFHSKDYFTHIEPWTNPIHTQVVLADGTSTAPICGVGTVSFIINNTYPFQFHNVPYVPSLSPNLFSVKEFLRYQGTLILGHNNIVTIAFPSFIFDANIDDEIHFQTTPTKQQPLFNSYSAPLHHHNSSNYMPKSILKQIFGKAYKGHKKLPSPITTKPKLPNTDSNKNINSKKNISDLLTNSLEFSSINDNPSVNTPDTENQSSPNIDNTSINEIPQNPPLPKTINQNTNQNSPTHSVELPPWLHHDSKITLKLKEDDPFFKGILIKNTDDLFLFHVGRSRKHGIKHPLPHAKLLDLYNKGFVLRTQSFIFSISNTQFYN